MKLPIQNRVQATPPLTASDPEIWIGPELITGIQMKSVGSASNCLADIAYLKALLVSK